MKIITILGARPQFIKAGSVSREILRQQKNGVDIQEIIVHTGQHYDTNMSDIFFNEMKIPKPDYYLGVGGVSHGAMTGQMIEKIEKILIEHKAERVMVYGDTNSTLAGSIAASKLHIKIAHVESGLRSFNMKMPEEINRILTDRISSMLFCPTQTAIDNLKNEGVENWDAKVVLSGDVMLDGAIFYKKYAKKPDLLDLNNDFILCTIHRAENTDDENRMIEIFQALEEIGKEKQIILPLHPRTKKIISDLKISIKNLTLIEPVGYLEMVWFLENCQLVITDSGGLQKEAYFFGKPCITLRDETEWVELVDNGFNALVGADKNKILYAYQNQLISSINNSKLNLYGDANASKIIVDNLLAV